MKKFFLAASLLMALLAGAPEIEAKPAKPGVMTVSTADGSSLRVRLVGDEYFHYYLSEDGYLLVERDGNFYYADFDRQGDIVNSGLRATDMAARPADARNYLSKVDKKRLARSLDARVEIAPRRLQAERVNPFRAPRAEAGSTAPELGFPLGPGLFPGTSFPSKGKQKALVVLVEYKDKKFSVTDPHDYFTRMLNEPGFNDYGGTGCAKEFFELCSGGVFQPEFDVMGPITLKQNMSYYGGNDYFGNDNHPEEMVIEACQQLDATVDFSEYDRDGDGYIDNVFVFYAGMGEASGGAANTVWPHSWDVTAATSVPYVFDGVRLDRYGCSNEWEGGRPDGVGTFIHEFSHVMGLPDLYSTSYTNAFTPGAWSALDYGPYNNDGMTPPLYGAFERYALGWMEPQEIKGAMNATLSPISDNVAGIIKTSDSNEFFLLENRQQTSWDTYIPGHGMLVWHVDYDSSVWASNRVNNSTAHQYVDLEEADDTRSDYNRDGDSFPGASNVTSFTDNTRPSMKTWSGSPLSLPITEIAESADGIITFKVKGGRQPLEATVALEAEDIDDQSFTARWQPTDGLKYQLSVYTRDEDGTVHPVTGFSRRNVGATDRATVTGLEPYTAYFYTVTGFDGLELAPASQEIEVFTGAPTIARFTVEATEATDVHSTGFTASWLPLEGATDYLLTVFARELGASIPETADFTDGVTVLPEGWTASSQSSYANTSYSGQAVPAMRMGKSGDYIAAAYDDNVRGLSFWHRGNGTSEGDVINVIATTANDRVTVATVPVVTDKGGIVTELNDFPEGTLSVRIEFVRTGAKGSLAIDDVTVFHGITYSDNIVEGYDRLATGNTTSYPVTGLLPEKEYHYTVTATDGTLFSRPSADMKVTTLEDNGQSGIVAIEAAGVTVALDRRTLSVEAPASATVTVTDISGRTIAAASGSLHITLPAPGVYIVKSAGLTRKLIVN